jgi:hypothetical protein
LTKAIRKNVKMSRKGEEEGRKEGRKEEGKIRFQHAERVGCVVKKKGRTARRPQSRKDGRKKEERKGD